MTAPSRPASLPEGAVPTDAGDGRPATAFWPHPSGVLQVVTVPVTIDLERPELLGALTMGYLLDAERAGALKALTGADVAFAYDGTVRASSFPDDIGDAVAPWIHADQHVPVLSIADDDYSALVRPLAGAAGRGLSRRRAAAGGGAAVAHRADADARHDSGGAGRHRAGDGGAGRRAQLRHRPHRDQAAGDDHRPTCAMWPRPAT